MKFSYRVIAIFLGGFVALISVVGLNYFKKPPKLTITVSDVIPMHEDVVKEMLVKNNYFDLTRNPDKILLQDQTLTLLFLNSRVAYDSATDLQWKVHASSNKVTYAGALNYIHTLNSHDKNANWTIPTLEQAASLISIDKSRFFDNKFRFWTCNSVPNQPNFMWTVYYDQRHCNDDHMDSKFYVRAVRRVSND